MQLTGASGSTAPQRLLLLGGHSEIGLAILAALAGPPETEVLLAGRDRAALIAAAATLPYKVEAIHYDALETAGHDAFADRVFARGPVDLVISAAGVLTPQPELEADVRRAAAMIDANFTGHVTTLLAVAAASATSAWAVGYTGLITPRTLILHWNGKTWS